MTKLEAFTMAAMQGLAAAPNYNPKEIGTWSNDSIRIAKSTLDALAKEQGIIKSK